MLKKRERELLKLGLGTLLADDLVGSDRAVVRRLTACGWMNQTYRGGIFQFETSERGLVELRRPAPPPKSGRTQCINPVCAVTGSAEEFPSQMICGRCFRQTGDLRTEYRALRARWKQVEKLERKHGRSSGALAILDRRMEANWQAIVDFFTAPEKPEGLETFLEEMGWAHGQDEQQPARPEEL